MIDRHAPLAKNVFLSANFWTVWRRQNCLGQKNTMFDRKFDQIIYCFWKDQPICQEMREKLPHIQFYGGFPQIKDLIDPTFHTLLVINTLFQTSVLFQVHG